MIETLNNKLQEVTLQDGSKELNYYYGLCIITELKELLKRNIGKQK